MKDLAKISPKANPILLLILVPLLVRCNTPTMPPLPAPPPEAQLSVAVLLPTTGEMAVFGQQLRHGLEMAFDEANNQGDMGEQRIQWQLYDSGCSYHTAGRAIRQAVGDGFQFIIGPLCTEAAIAAAEYADTEPVLLIVPAATHPLATVRESGQPRATVFRISPVLSSQGQAAAQFAVAQLQAESGAVIAETGDEYSTAVGRAFADRFSKSGGRLLGQATLNPYQPDIEAQVKAVFGQKPQALFVPGTPALINRVAVLLDETWPADTNKPTLLGSDRWSAPDVKRELVENSYFTTYFALPPESDHAQSWARAYKAAYAIEPEPLAGLGYESASVLLAAIRQSQNVSPGVVAETMQRDTFAGLTGPIQFDQQHNPLRTIPMLHLNDNQTEYFSNIQLE